MLELHGRGCLPQDMLLELSFEVKELTKLIVGKGCSRKKEKLVRDLGT